MITTSIILLFIGILCFVIPNCKWYIKSLKRNSSSEFEEFLCLLRKFLGVILIVLSVFIFYSNL